MRVIGMLGRVVAQSPDGVRARARGGRARRHAAARDRDRRRRGDAAHAGARRARSRSGSSRTRSLLVAEPGRAPSYAAARGPAAASTARTDRVRVRGLRVPAAGHEPRRRSRAQLDAALARDRQRRGDVGAGRKLFGDGPAERDERLAPRWRRARRRARRSWPAGRLDRTRRRAPGRTAACGP